MAIVTKTAESEIMRRADTGAGYVDWGAILAGAVVSTAVRVNTYVSPSSSLASSLLAASRMLLSLLRLRRSVGLLLVTFGPLVAYTV